MINTDIRSRAIDSSVFYKKMILRDFMFVSDDSKVTYIVCGTDLGEYYFFIRNFIKINYFYDPEEKGREKYRGIGIIRKNTLMEMIEDDPDSIRMIVFSHNYPETVAELAHLGLNPFKQIFDGRFLFGDKQSEEYKLEKHSYHHCSQLLISAASHEETGGIFTYDIKNKGFQNVCQGDFRGIKKCNNGYIAMEETRGLLRLNEDLEVVNEISIFDTDVHGLAVNPDNDSIIFLSETAYDRIGIYDLDEQKKIEQFDLNGGLKADRFHINDLLMHNGEFYLSLSSLNGAFKSGKLWHNDGGIATLNMNTYSLDEVIFSQLNGPHSLMNWGNDFLFCNAFKGEVRFNTEVLCKLNGFLRGLDFDGCTLYIGQSRFRALLHPQFGYAGASNDAGIHFYIPSIRMSHFIPMPFVDQVYSICAI
jgi:hypothetical protein